VTLYPIAVNTFCLDALPFRDEARRDKLWAEGFDDMEPDCACGREIWIAAPGDLIFDVNLNAFQTLRLKQPR